MTQRVQEIYTKLFKALGEGGAKEEEMLTQRLRQRFSVPPKVRLSKYLAENVEPEAVFVEIATALEPFSLMLQEIYGFLDRNRATIQGKADQFSLRFEAINESLPFGLDAFPKTYLQALRVKQIEVAMLNPDAPGNDLLVDMPFTLSGENALENLGRHPLLIELTHIIDAAPGNPDALGFIENHRIQIERLTVQAERVLALCMKVLTYRREGSGRFDGHMYYRDKEAMDLWTRRVGSREDREALFQGNRIFDLAVLHDFRDAWSQFCDGPLGVQGSGYRIPAIPDEDLFARQLVSFDRAYGLAITCETRVEEQLNQVIDQVILPFWRHRWRLYEVWALVQVMSCLPRDYTSGPRLSPVDGTSEWVIPHGKAKQPVGLIQGDGRELEVWFQRETPIRIGGHIEPDIRIMTPSGRDVVILELKDRHECATSPLTKCAMSYALNTGAPLVVLANYGRFASQSLSGRTDRVGSSIVRYLDLFTPGNVPEDVLAAVREAVKNELWHYNFLADVSSSTDGIDILGFLSKFAELTGKLPNRVFTFADHLLAESTDMNSLDFTPQGGTNLAQVMEEYTSSRAEATITVILTDSDGQQQYRRLRSDFTIHTYCFLYNDGITKIG